MKYITPSLLLALATVPAFAQIPVAGTTTHAETFNSLPSDANATALSWDDNFTVPGWYIHRSNSAVPLAGSGLIYYAADGSTAPNAAPMAHGIYSAGSDANRSLAASPTTALGEISTIAIFQNTSANAVRLTTLGYTGKVFRSNTGTAAANRETTSVSYLVAANPTAITDTLATTAQGASMPPAAGFVAFNPALSYTYDSLTDGAGVQLNPPRTFVMAPTAPTSPILLLPGQAIAIRWSNLNDGGTDAIIGIDDVSVGFEAVPCAIDGVVSNATRNTNGTPADPSDDTYGFDLTVTGVGASAAGWEIVAPAAYASTGTYGTTRTFTGLPIPSAPVTLTVRDRVDNGCTDTFAVSAPVIDRYVTATVSQALTFTDAPNGAQSFVRGETGDLGFTGGTAAAIVRTQPDPNNFSKYFGINNGRPTLTTDPVNISAIDALRASVGLAAYTTSGTALEAPDTITVTVETASDAAGPWAPVATIIDGNTVDGVTLFNQIRVADPGINYPTAQPYPAANFPFATFRSAAIPTAGATYARLVVAGGNDSGSEFTLIDDIRFERASCLITATPVTIVRDNKSDDNPANDEFTVQLSVTAEAQGASTGWTSNAIPASGAYGIPVTFGPFPVSGGPRTVTFTDSLNTACQTPITLTPPAAQITLGPVNGLFRNQGADATTATDDLYSFNLIVNGVDASTGWTARAGSATGPVIGSGDYGTVANLQLPTDLNQVVFVDRAEPATTTTLTLDLSGVDMALGLRSTAGTTSVLYFAPPLTGHWRPTGSALPLGAPPTVAGLYSSVLANGDSTGLALETEAVDLSTTTGPTFFSAQLVAFDNSAGSNMETNDTFQITLELTLEGTVTPAVVNLVTALPGADSNGFPAATVGALNGYTGAAVTGPPAFTALEDYNNNRAFDEFNREGTAGELTMVGTFNFAYSIPKQFNDAGTPRNVISAKAVVRAINNSNTEFFYLKDVNFSDTAVPDSDADGLLDAWELQYFGNLAQTGAGDPDGDGQSNASEQLAGTEPNNGQSALAVTSITRTGADFSVTWNSVAGKTYRAEFAPDLGGPWTIFPTTVTATGPTSTASGTIPPPIPDRLFMRVRLVP